MNQIGLWPRTASKQDIHDETNFQPLLKRFDPAICIALLLLTAFMMPGTSHSAIPKDAEFEVIEGQIDEFRQVDDKTFVVSMPPYARNFCIHRNYSPLQDLLDKAKALSGTGTTVQAKVWVRDPALNKANPQGSGVPGPPWVIINLHVVTEMRIETNLRIASSYSAAKAGLMRSASWQRLYR